MMIDVHNHHYQSGGGGSSWRSAMVKGSLATMAMCLICYILGPPLYWHITEGIAAISHSSATCPPCVCNCDSTSSSHDSIQSLLSIPIDCVKHDPTSSEDTDRNFTELLSEEIKQQEAVALENQRRADMALLEAKKAASQYQKEADKCNSGMGTCEEAREKAEAALITQKRLSEMWELRARQRGWQEGAADI